MPASQAPVYPSGLDRVAEQFGLTAPELIEMISSGELAVVRPADETLPEGIPGEVLAERAQQVNFDPADLATMQRAIEEDCEKIDPDEW